MSRRDARSNAANGGGVTQCVRAPGVDNLIFVDDVEGLTGVAGIQDVSPRGMLDGERDIVTDTATGASAASAPPDTRPASRAIIFSRLIMLLLRVVRAASR